MQIKNKLRNVFCSKQKAKDNIPPSQTNIFIDMVKVEGGSFVMGQGPGAGQSQYGNMVELSDFEMSKTPVTQELWKIVMGEDSPSYFKSPKRPVVNVSWYDCQSFIYRLNQLTGLYYRLPTEAEWEYAASGGRLSKKYIYAGSDQLDDVAWHSKLKGVQAMTHTVGCKKPNELGLYDMTGNIWEWCLDHSKTYSNIYCKNPIGTVFDDVCFAIRGGSWKAEWFSIAKKRYAIRHRNNKSIDYQNDDCGFRLVRPISNPLNGINIKEFDFFDIIYFPILKNIGLEMHLSYDKRYYIGIIPWSDLKRLDEQQIKHLIQLTLMSQDYDEINYHVESNLKTLIAPFRYNKMNLYRTLNTIVEYLNPTIKEEPISSNQNSNDSYQIRPQSKPNPDIASAIRTLLKEFIYTYNMCFDFPAAQELTAFNLSNNQDVVVLRFCQNEDLYKIASKKNR